MTDLIEEVSTEMPFTKDDIDEALAVSETDSRAGGAASTIRADLFREIEPDLSMADEELQDAESHLETLQDEIEKLDGDHDPLKGKLRDAWTSMEDAWMHVNEAQAKTGRQFHSIENEDRFTLMASCENAVPEMTNIVLRQREELAECKTAIELYRELRSHLEKKAQKCQDKMERMKSQVEAFGPFIE